MVNQQQLAGNWQEIKGAIKRRWGQLTDRELTEAEGNTEQLIGLIQRKTGEARDAIERFLDDVVPQATSTARNIASTARGYAEAAGEQVSQAYEKVSERVQQGYEAAQETVREKPLQSLGLAFGAGVLIGVVVGVMLRSR
jgi:uncharacterized protein YjbJ (UPF0337 family)